MCDILSQIPLNMPDGLVFLTLELSESEQSFPVWMPAFTRCSLPLCSLMSLCYLLLQLQHMTESVTQKVQQEPWHSLCSVNLHPQLHLLSIMFPFFILLIMNLIPFWKTWTTESFWNCLHNIVRGNPAIFVCTKRELIILIFNKHFYIAVKAIFKSKVFLELRGVLLNEWVLKIVYTFD